MRLFAGGVKAETAAPSWIRQACGKFLCVPQRIPLIAEAQP